jgi:acyl carrier protein
MKNFDILKKIILNNINNKNALIKKTSFIKDFDTWDSINIMKIFIEIEKKFKKKIKIEKYNSSKKISDILSLIEGK